MLTRLVKIIVKVLGEKHHAQLDFIKARYEFLGAVPVLRVHSLQACCADMQNSDGIFPNAAIAKKLGEVMGDSSQDISHKSDK